MNVIWIGGRRLCWDQHTLDAALASADHLEAPMPHDDAVVALNGHEGGAIVVVPAQYVQPWQVNHLVAQLPWCVLVLTSDEASTFDQTQLDHPAMLIWTMTPRPGVHEPGTRHLGEGAPDLEQMAGTEPARRTLDVQFAGQITHERRQQLAAAWAEWSAERDATVGSFIATPGFTQGLDRGDYLAQLVRAKLVLAPSGPTTPDSFRLYEALEAGALPIADGLCPGYDEPGYWDLVYPGGVPFPVVHDWHAELGKTIEAALAGWPANATRASAWWAQAKRQLRCHLEDDAADLAGAVRGDTTSEITVLVTTSPTSRPARDQIAMLDETLASVRDRLPHAEVLVAADGVRDEQRHLAGEYEQFLAELVWACHHRWTRATPWIFDHHAHQANATRVLLEHVRTPLVLFVEHDTPLCGEIPWAGLSALVRSGAANLVRFHHEAHVLGEHQHLMLDSEPRCLTLCGSTLQVPVLRTVQWSQRPHLASTGFYRHLLGSYFGTESRTMIEDVMHGVVQTAWNLYGLAGWEQYRLVMYAPAGDMKRSLHSDGRGRDPKFDNVYRYDGDVPTGAPQPR